MSEVEVNSEVNEEQQWTQSTTLTMCPKWIFSKVKVLSAGLSWRTIGWMDSFRYFSMYIPKNGQACSKS